MKKILFKDVAHLYLGCDLKAVYRTKDGDTGKEVLVDLNNRKLVGVFSDGTVQWDFGTLDAEMRPILRKLSDMTKEEGLDAINIVVPEKDSWIGGAKRTIWLAQKGFDLFGLIESGEAIDAKTLKS